MEKNERLKNILINKSPILFLGAGFSYGATKNNNLNEEVTKNLSKKIKTDILKLKEDDDYYDEINNYDLKDLSKYTTKKIGKEKFEEFLIQEYGALLPAEFHKKITRYPWRKIYSTNIDDLIEKIYEEAGKEIVVQNSKNENLAGHKQLELIKLHGCVRNKKEGFIFTSEEYINRMTGNQDFKLSEFARDAQKEDIIFIGTSFDEIDVEYYLNLYKKAGYMSGKGSLIFINPSPTLKLVNLVEDSGGIIIKWTTEEFLDFVCELQYNPGEIERLEKQLIYSGFHRMSDIRIAFDNENEYSSKLYQGYEAKWQDIFQEWDFLHPINEKILNDIKTFNGFDSNKKVHCSAICSNSYLGKTTLIKRIASELSKQDFEVIEFNGNEFNIKVLKEYILKSNYEKYALIFDNASPNYPVIERLLKDETINKLVFIIASSRSYYHNKKKYYLEGNSYKEYIITRNISNLFANNILNKLDEKGYLGYLRKQRKREDRIKLIRKEPELMALMIKLSGEGTGFVSKIQADVKQSIVSNKINKSIITTLSILDIMDIEYFPSELIPIMYNLSYNYVVNDNEYLSNMIKVTSGGIAIRNGYYSNTVLNSIDEDEKIECIYDLLINISPQVNEKKLNYYKIIFEHLTKEDKLRKELNISANNIKNLYYRIKRYYENISYYWLQLGLIEQHLGDFTRALNHLQQAEGIKPSTYQIEHAIGRNYLRYANSLENLEEAQGAFLIGEKRLIKLIENQDILQPLAYSINCYLNEKIKFIDKFKLEVTKNECIQMFRYIKIMISKSGIRSSRDISIIKKFFELIKEKKITGVIVFKDEERNIYDELKNKRIIS